MKSNNLANKIGKKNLNFVKNARYYLAVVAALIISAIVLVCVLGFNLGFDFKGGTVVEVVYDIPFDENGSISSDRYSEAEAKANIENVLKEFGGFELSSVQVAETEYGNAVVYKLLRGNTLSNEDFQKIENELYKEFSEYDQNGLIQSNYISVYGVQGTQSKTAVYGSIALSVGIVLLTLLALWRFGISAGISIFLTSIINALLTIATVLICRMTIDASFVGVVLGVFAITLIMNLIYFDKVRENAKNKDLSRSEIANKSVKQSAIPNLLIFAVGLICSILLGGLGTLPIRAVGIPMLVGLFYAVLSAIYLAPFFWNYIVIKPRAKTKK